MHLESILGCLGILDVNFVDIRGDIHGLAVENRNILTVSILLGLGLRQATEAIFGFVHRIVIAILLKRQLF